jgi:hypothetical protein
MFNYVECGASTYDQSDDIGYEDFVHLVFLSLVKGCGLEGQRIPRLGLLCMESLAFWLGY